MTSANIRKKTFPSTHLDGNVLKSKPFHLCVYHFVITLQMCIQFGSCRECLPWLCRPRSYINILSRTACLSQRTDELMKSDNTQYQFSPITFRQCATCFTSTQAVISFDAYLAPYIQLYHHYGIKHLMLLLVIRVVMQIQ